VNFLRRGEEGEDEAAASFHPKGAQGIAIESYLYDGPLRCDGSEVDSGLAGVALGEPFQPKGSLSLSPVASGEDVSG